MASSSSLSFPTLGRTYNWHQMVDENNKICLTFGPEEAPKSEIPLKSIERCVLNLIKTRDLNGLRRLCNILFSGAYPAWLRNRRVPSIKLLERQIYDNRSDLVWEAYTKLILTATTE